MSVKEEVLQALEANRGTQISGGVLAEQLNVSRTAVWKAIRSLVADGLCIASTTGGGYLLSTDDDSLTESGIAALLHTQALGRSLVVLPRVASTNTLLKTEYADAAHGFTVIAAEQTAGRGRLGRPFVSPAGSGLYLSILLKPFLPIEHMNFITIAAAIAACRTIRKLCGFDAQVKWVNDIVMRGKKLCGILTEATIEAETGLLSSVIVGIGINRRFDKEAFPELAEIAGGLSDFTEVIPRRAVLAAELLEQFEAVLTQLQQEQFDVVLAEYRSLLCCIGKKITVITPQGHTEALCTGINQSGHLLVTMPNGEYKVLSSGEISIRV